MSLGNKLRNLRLNAKNTLKEQSDIFGVSVNSVYRWEHNLTIPRKTTLKAISDYYNIPIDWLLLENADSLQENNIERQIMNMFKQLSYGNKYKVLGYVEHIIISEAANDPLDAPNDTNRDL